MKKAILATKVGMTQIFNEDGSLTPVTVLQAGPCAVTQIKTVENDGYSAVQVGFVDKKEKIVNKDKGGKKEVIHRHGVNKAQKGHFDKAGVSCKRFVRELKLENAEEYTLGSEIKADIFEAGDRVDATAISKGKGFQSNTIIPRDCCFNDTFFHCLHHLQPASLRRRHGSPGKRFCAFCGDQAGHFYNTVRRQEGNSPIVLGAYCHS